MSELPIEIKLQFPITLTNNVGDIIEKIESFTVSRRPLAKDFKGINMSNMQFDDVIKLISRMCNVPVSTAENLDTSDFMEIQEVILNFLPQAGR